MPVIKIKKKGLPRAQMYNSQITTTTTTMPPTGKSSTAGPFGIDMTKLSNFAQQVEANAPKEDVKAGRMADQGVFNPFDVKWGQEKVNPEIDIAGSMSHKPLDRFGTSSQEGKLYPSQEYNTLAGKGALNLPQLVNTDLLSKDKKPEKQKFDWDKFGRRMGRVGAWGNVGLNIAGAAADYFTDRQKQKDWDKWFREQNLPDNMYAVSPGNDRGDFDINEGIYRPNQLTPPNVGAAVAQFGGAMIKDTDMDRIRIRIKSGPSNMAYGGQAQGMALGLDLGQKDVYRHMPKEKSEEVRGVIPEAPREKANIEAEKGETVYGDLDGDGALEHLKIGGKRHVDGGTPLNVPEGSFIFSDTKKMIIKDPSILEKFGMSPRKEGYTPAEIAKRYDVNKYKAIMEDPNTDNVRKSTAQIMIKSFQKKLGELALIQESMKNFPQGIPEIAKKTVPELAEQYAKEYGVEEAMEGEANQQEQVMEQGMTEPEEEMMGEEESMEQPMEEQSMEEEMPEARYGGSRLPRYQGATTGSTVNSGRYPVWNPEYQDVISGYIKDKYDVKVPINARDQADPNRFTLPAVQSSRGGKRIYGEEDWMDPEHMADFTERQGEFLKENPNWDPTKPGATKKFQQWYNTKAAELGLPQYFGKGQRFQGLDDKFGEYTFSAPSLFPKRDSTVIGYSCTGRDANGKPQIQSSSYKDEAARQAAGAAASSTEAEKQCPEKEQPYTSPGTVKDSGKPVRTRTGWMTPDIVNMAAATAVAPKKYLPYIAPTQFEPGRLSLEDWRGMAAARQSMFNKAAETMGVYGPTTGQAANTSSAAGQQAEGLAGDIAGVTSRNVDRLNQWMQGERQRKDQFNMLGADRATELYKGNVIANQQYDNARRQYLNNIAKTYGQGWKNKMMLGMLNAVNPLFQVSPFSGDSYFTGRGKGFDQFSRSAGQSMATDFASLKNQYMAMGMKEDNAEKLAIKALTNSGNPSASASDYLNQYTSMFG